MISRALNALGLMTRAEHEQIVFDLDERGYKQWEASTNNLEAAWYHRDQALDERDDALAKFKLAATDLAKQAEEIAAYKEGAKALSRIIDSGVEEIKAQQGLVSALTEKNVELVGRIETLKGYHRRDTEEIESLRPDALLWRNARDKRSRNRRGVKTNG